MDDTFKRYLSVAQICEQLPVCKSLVYRLIKDGKLPATRLGGKILVPVDELEAMLQAGQERREAPELPPLPRTPRQRSREKNRINLW